MIKDVPGRTRKLAPKRVEAYRCWKENPKIKRRQLADELGVSLNTVSTWLARFRKADMQGKTYQFKGIGEQELERELALPTQIDAVEFASAVLLKFHDMLVATKRLEAGFEELTKRLYEEVQLRKRIEETLAQVKLGNDGGFKKQAEAVMSQLGERKTADAECVHYMILGLPTGSTVHGTCAKCGFEKDYPARMSRDHILLVDQKEQTAMSNFFGGKVK